MVWFSALGSYEKRRIRINRLCENRRIAGSAIKLQRMVARSEEQIVKFVVFVQHCQGMVVVADVAITADVEAFEQAASD